MGSPEFFLRKALMYSNRLVSLVSGLFSFRAQDVPFEGVGSEHVRAQDGEAVATLSS